MPSVLLKSNPKDVTVQGSVGPRTAPKQASRGAQKHTNSDPSFLSLYFQEMSALKVLPPEEELQIAQKIETLEACIWTAILSNPTILPHIVARIEPDLQNPPSLAPLKVAAAANDTSLLRKLAKSIGIELRDSDKDRLVLIDTILHLRTLREKKVRDPLFVLPNREFDSYLKTVLHQDRIAQEARNKFVKANLRLVVSIARRFNFGRMSLADLIQEGNLGLIKAVERFDYRKGFRFSTYASWWIRHAISRGLADKGRVVRLPVHMIEAQQRIGKAKREFNAKFSRPPTNEELSEATEIGLQKIEKMRTYLVDGSTSFDKPMNDSDGRTLAEVLEDPNTTGDAVIERIGDAAESSQVRELMDKLKPIEAAVLRHRFGFDNDQEQTLREIGDKYNLSRERIRQLQEQALKKMRRALSVNR